MSCYHPLIGVYTGELTKNGKKKIHIIGNADNYTIDEFRKNGNGLLIPCGKCIGCRLDYSRKWADRMMLELATAKKGIFVTLTYNNQALNGFDEDGKFIGVKWSQFDENDNPMYATLDKRECQLWMKRLRKEFDNIRIRFYLAGEYGSDHRTFRPHYHAILFGISLNDVGDCIPFGRNELGQQYYKSERIRRTWKRGHVIISDVSWHTCAYVSRYVTKKLNGTLEELYAYKNVAKEFALMSRNPGLGYDYLSEHPDCLDFVDINLSTPQGGRKIQIPKYYLNQIREDRPDYYEELMRQRKRFAEDKNLIKLSLTDYGFTDMLEAEEDKKKSDTKVLKRTLL